MIARNDAARREVGDDLIIASISRRSRGGGTWVRGALADHRFEALVFPEHAEDPAWELGESRISKLWVRREADGEVVFNWDRGADVEAADDVASAVVAFLAGGLAEYLFGELEA